ncbi:site-specific DNA-methyltransferase [Xenorhabdus cabanillasii JM26]|nr:site-specific DNA-methyltransferase [Xenorhabdus cabanillasii JM26]
MLYPRLKLARNLLKDSGAIFISIGDRELANLIKICCEVFGEENHIATLVWEKKKKGAFLSGTHTNIKEYVIVFAKNISECLGVIGETTSEMETYPVIKTTNKRGVRVIRAGIESKYKDKNIYLPAGHRISAGNQEMILISPMEIKSSILINDVEIDSNWIYSQSSIDEFCSKNELYITQDLYFRRVVSSVRHKKIKDLLPRVGTSGDSSPSFKRSDNLFDDGWGTNEDANNELHKLFGKQNVFQFTKPAKLISKLISSFTVERDIVLDFFAGSGTTGNAVYDFNNQSGKDVRFILVQLPELLDKNNKDQIVAYNFCRELNLPTHISSLTKERLIRSDTTNEGFRFFKLDKTNIRVWDVDFDNLEQVLQKASNSVKNGRNAEDILYEILLKYGIELTTHVEEVTVEGKKIFVVGTGALIVCLDDDITEQVIEGIAKLKEKLNPESMQVVFKDQGFADCIVKTNAIQILKQYGINDVKSI